MGISLFDEVKANGLLMLSLHGVRTVLENELGIVPILIATDDTVKQEYTRRDHEQFPMAHIEVNEIMGVRDQTSNRTIQRLGVRVGSNGHNKATSRRGYLFPVTVGVTLKYAHSDPMEYIAMTETLAILSMLGGISFDLQMNVDFSFHVRVEIPEQTAIPLAERENTQTPGGVEIECSLIVHTVVGFFRDIAAVQSDRPKIEYTIENKTYLKEMGNEQQKITGD